MLSLFTIHQKPQTVLGVLYFCTWYSSERCYVGLSASSITNLRIEPDDILRIIMMHVEHRLRIENQKFRMNDGIFLSIQWPVLWKGESHENGNRTHIISPVDLILSLIRNTQYCIDTTPILLDVVVRIITRFGVTLEIWLIPQRARRVAHEAQIPIDKETEPDIIPSKIARTMMPHE